MQPIGTVWKTLVGGHPGIIPVEFGQIANSDLGEVIQSFPSINQRKTETPGWGSILTLGHNLSNFGRGPLYDVI